MTSKGADDHYLVRNLINATGFMCYHSGSARVAAHPYSLNTTMRYQWSFIVGAIIFSTLQMQDMSDQAGDAHRNRGTLPLLWSDAVASMDDCNTSLSVVCFLSLLLANQLDGVRNRQVQLERCWRGGCFCSGMQTRIDLPGESGVSGQS